MLLWRIDLHRSPLQYYSACKVPRTTNPRMHPSNRSRLAICWSGCLFFGLVWGLNHMSCFLPAYLSQDETYTRIEDEGTDVKLSCYYNLTIRPPIIYRWHKHGQKGDISHSVTYTIRNVALQASGVYSCTVTGKRGHTMVRKNITLFVQGKGHASL